MQVKRKTNHYKKVKRFCDVFFSTLLLLLFFPLLLFFIFLSYLDSGKLGVFSQQRVGINKTLFVIYKIRTYRVTGDSNSISKYGKFLRKFKLDELPQLWNILIGDMSFVGPRPEIVGFADTLKGNNALILTVKPGLTCPASIMFKNEEYILEKKDAPEHYYKNVIWPKKIELNLEYVKNLSFKNDFFCLLKTVFIYVS